MGPETRARRNQRSAEQFAGLRKSSRIGEIEGWSRSAEIQHPGLDGARARVLPHDVADAVMVEIADADRNRARRARAGIEADGPLAVLDQPDIDVVGRRVVPGDV